MVNPVPGHSVGTPYRRQGPLWSLGWHTGTDFPAPAGTPIVAAAPGRVVAAGAYDASYGYKVIIAGDDGHQHWYCHMPAGAAIVSVGQRVAAGQRIGAVGTTGNSTGPHLHLEVRAAPYSFAASTFRDPMSIVNQAGGGLDMSSAAEQAIFEIRDVLGANQGRGTKTTDTVGHKINELHAFLGAKNGMKYPGKLGNDIVQTRAAVGKIQTGVEDLKKEIAALRADVRDVRLHNGSANAGKLRDEGQLPNSSTNSAKLDRLEAAVAKIEAQLDELAKGA